MMDKDLLQKFCSDDTTRPAITTPFNANGFTYATDGHIGIRVPLIEGFPPSQLMKISEIINYSDVPEEKWVRISDIKFTRNYYCSHCHRDGAEMTVNTEVEGKLLNGKLLKIIAMLPNAEIAPGAVEKYKPIPIRFDGGIGIVMPMSTLVQ